MEAAPTPLVGLVDSKAAARHESGGNELALQELGLRSSSEYIPNNAAQHAIPPPHFVLSEQEQATSFPEGGLESWLCVVGAFFLLLPTFGMTVSIGALQNYWQENQLAAYTTRDIGWIPSVFVYLLLALSIWVGPLFDHYGPRAITLIGSVFLAVMFFLLAECTKYWQFMLCFGVLGGCSAAALATTALGCVSHWFRLRRGLATGIAMAGSSTGGVLIPLLLRATFPRYGWTWSIRILAFAMLVCLVIGNTFIKGRLRPDPNAAKQAMISLSIFRDTRFTLLSVSVFGFEVVLVAALGLLPTYASSAGFPANTGFYLVAVLNAFSCLGRFLPGLAADILGRFNVLLIMILTTLIFMLALWLPLGTTSLPVLYVFSALFGFGTGSWMALTPVCIGQLCSADQFGRYYGTCYFVASLATLVSVPIGGELAETVGPRAMVGFFCAVLTLAMGAFALGRWACLDWRWKWLIKI